MGGEIAVDSSPGAGACFHFQIPAAPCAPLVRVPVVQPDFAGVRLLVVDDNASNRDLAARIFVNLGFRVDVTGSGLEGVAACAQAVYDLILMDIRMPEVDGPTAARMIRDGGSHNRLCPILAFTADVDAGLDQRYPGLFDGMVRKPIEPAQLLSAVAACLPEPTVAVPAPIP
jgi:CheY-like chemotaxis protein